MQAADSPSSAAAAAAAAALAAHLAGDKSAVAIHRAGKSLVALQCTVRSAAVCSLSGVAAQNAAVMASAMRVYAAAGSFHVAVDSFATAAGRPEAAYEAVLISLLPCLSVLKLTLASAALLKTLLAA